MAHVKDEGVFDVPLDRIWTYLQDQNSGVHNHKAIRSWKVVEEQGSMTTNEIEFVNPDGRSTRKETWRMTFHPPKGFDMEALSGVSQGTKYTLTYTPMGNRTKVEVEGEFRMSGMDDDSTRRAALGFLNEVFEEDQVNLRRYNK
jgi:hypothetical protein